MISSVSAQIVRDFIYIRTLFQSFSIVKQVNKKKKKLYIYKLSILDKSVKILVHIDSRKSLLVCGITRYSRIRILLWINSLRLIVKNTARCFLFLINVANGWIGDLALLKLHFKFRFTFRLILIFNEHSSKRFCEI